MENGNLEELAGPVCLAPSGVAMTYDDQQPLVLQGERSGWSKQNIFWSRRLFPIFKSIYINNSQVKVLLEIAAAAAKLLQSCPILCDPVDSSPPRSPIPGILQARTLEWVAISFSNA